MSVKYDVDRIYKYIDICVMMKYSSRYKMVRYIYRKLGLKGTDSSKRDLNNLNATQKRDAYFIVLGFLDKHLPNKKK